MYHKISIIIPVKYDNEDPSVLKSLKDVRFPEDRIEIILVTDRNPSLQRNKTVRMAMQESNITYSLLCSLYSSFTQRRAYADYLYKLIYIYKDNGNSLSTGEEFENILLYGK